MFKKFTSGTLIIIMIVLMGIYLIVQYTGSKNRTFRDKILSFDAASVTQILIKDPKSSQEPVDLRFEGGKWIVKAGGQDYNADTNVVKNILKQLSDMPTKRYAGKGKDAWVKYELTDTSASMVTVKASEKTVAEILIGKFTYNIPKDQQQQQQMQSRQQRGEMTSYVRLADEKDVYAVDGYLKMTFSSKADSYRYRNLVSVNPADITRITINEPGIKKILENQDGKWLLDGIPADSTKAVKFRSALGRLTGSKFIDQAGGQSYPAYSLMIEGNNFTPVELQAYPVADTNVAYVISSSANPGSYFNGKEGGLFKKIWQADIQ
jgi:hypothetical protein